MKNRKFTVFVISVIAIMILNFFNKDGSSAITTLAIALFAANCAQKSNFCNDYNKKMNEEKE